MRSNLKYALVSFLVFLMALSFGIPVQAKEWRLRSGDVMSDVSPYGEGMAKFAELVQERSKGKIVIKHFPSGQLGKDNAIIDGVRMGSIDMAATGGLGSKVISGFAAPFLFNDHVHLDRFFASPVWQDIKSAYQKETGIHLIGGAYFPPRMMTTKNTEVVNPGDCKGLKIRVPPVPPLVNTWKALGASPTPIAFAELFTALQQGTVDAQENPLQIIHDQSYFEVQKYVAPIRYLTPPRFLIINQDLWEDLGEKNQGILQQCWEDAARLIQRRYIEKEQWWEDQLKAKGMIFTKPDIEAFRKATADVGKAIATNAWGADAYENIIELGKMHKTEVTWRMASKMPPKSPEGMAFQLFADRVKGLSGGKMEISMFPSEQLGKTDATMEQLQAGIIQIYAEGDAYLKKYVPDMKYTSLPFFFNDRQHWESFMNSEMVNGWLNEVAEKHNIMVLGRISDFVRGPYRVMVSTKPVNSLDDIKGMKLRMYPDELSLSVWKHLGMNTIILPWTEVYEGLGRGVVQAANSPIALVESMKFYEQAKYIIRHDEFPQGIAFMTNYKAYQSLSLELQGVLLTAHGDACAYSKEIMTNSAEESIDRMKSKGVSFTIVDRKPFVERANSLYKELESQGEMPKGFMTAVAKMAD